jgi:hypothetical protein
MYSVDVCIINKNIKVIFSDKMLSIAHPGDCARTCADGGA